MKVVQDVKAKGVPFSSENSNLARRKYKVILSHFEYFDGGTTPKKMVGGHDSHLICLPKGPRQT